MNLCHMKHAQLAKPLQKSEMRCSLACQRRHWWMCGLTADKVLDTMSLLEGMSRGANDAVSANILAKMSDASRLLPLPQTE